MRRLTLSLCISLSLASGMCIPSKYRAFIDLPREQQIETMRKMSTDEQIDTTLLASVMFTPRSYSESLLLSAAGRRFPPL
jgi:hypothetical protein